MTRGDEITYLGYHHIKVGKTKRKKYKGKTKEIKR